MNDTTKHTLLAILFVFFGTFFTALSYTLMKAGHKRIQLDSVVNQKKKKPLFRDVVWVGGILCIILGSAFNAVGMSYGNQVMLACTSSLTITFNTVMAIKMQKEPLKRR